MASASCKEREQCGLLPGGTSARCVTGRRASPCGEDAAQIRSEGGVTVRLMDDPGGGTRYAWGRAICKPPSSSMRERSSASLAALRFGSSSVRTRVPAVILIAAFA